MGFQAKLALCLLGLTILHNTGRVDGRYYRRCKQGWVHFGGSCYAVVDDTATWGSAQVSCQMLGGNLARISSRTENENIRSLLQRHKVHRAWIGLNDMVAEGRFMEIYSNSPASFTSFLPGQTHHHHEDCVEMYSHHGNWNDLDCSTHLGFVCEH